jgi:hypothetical protein
MLAAMALAACATPTPDGVVAQNDMLAVVLAGDSVRLEPKPGVKINALLQPSIERASGSAITFDAPGRTDDSAYFVLPPVARIAEARPVSGRLVASACPEGKRVCLAVVLPVEIH